MDAATVRIILHQPDRSAAHAYLLQVVEALRARFPSAVHLLLDAAGEILAFYDLPSEHHRQIDSPLPVRTNMGAPSCTDPGTFGGCAIGTYCSILSCMTDEINTHEAKTVLSGGRAAHALPPPP
jgi:hypothetical protein